MKASKVQTPAKIIMIQNIHLQPIGLMITLSDVVSERGRGH